MRWSRRSGKIRSSGTKIMIAIPSPTSTFAITSATLSAQRQGNVMPKSAMRARSVEDAVGGELLAFFVGEAEEIAVDPVVVLAEGRAGAVVAARGVGVANPVALVVLVAHEGVIQLHP